MKKLTSLLLLLLTTIALTAEEKKAPAEGSVFISITFQQPIKEQPLNGAPVMRSATIEIYEVKVVEGTGQLRKADTVKTIKAQKSFTGNDSATVSLPEGQYEAVCMADPPAKQSGSRLRKTIQFSLKSGGSEKAAFKY